MGGLEEPWEGQPGRAEASWSRPFPDHSMISPEYTTTDAHLAAFLVSEGAPLYYFQRLSPKKVLFSFPPSAELHVLLRLYWGGHPIPVIPSKLLATLHDLKCRSITRH